MLSVAATATKEAGEKQLSLNLNTSSRHIHVGCVWLFKGNPSGDIYVTFTKGWAVWEPTKSRGEISQLVIPPLALTKLSISRDKFHNRWFYPRQTPPWAQVLPPSNGSTNHTLAITRMWVRLGWGCEPVVLNLPNSATLSYSSSCCGDPQP